VGWVDGVVERVEAALVGVENPVEKRRLTVYRLRTMGYKLEDIAAELKVAYGTVRRDLDWCFENLPAAFANAEQFRHIALSTAEDQIQRLTDRLRSGTQNPDVTERVLLSVRDYQAKLLGAMAPREISGDITVRTALELPEGSSSL
jgi:hypothetical protein